MPMSLFKNNKNRNKVVNPYCSLGYWSNMESFLVYLFNFYYAISELEQNKQNNTIILFLLFIFLTKKWTSAVCGGVRAHPSHPPPPSYGPAVDVCLEMSSDFNNFGLVD